MGTTKATEPKTGVQAAPDEQIQEVTKATELKTVVQMAPEAKVQEEADDKLRIFISHKIKDKEAAEKIRDELVIFGAGRLEFFLSENIPYGEDWSERIHIELRKADRLLLVYTDPTAEWDWCLYETGFFKATEETQLKRRAICLHSNLAKPPDPMRRWQAVSAEEGAVVNLLEQIFGEEPRPGVLPINLELAKNKAKLKEIASRIIKLIGPPTTSTFYNNFICLHLSPAQVQQLDDTKEVPAEVVVKSNRESLLMFGLTPKAQGDWTWAEIVDGLKNPQENGWAKNLGALLKVASCDKAFNPYRPHFRSPGDNKLYRPVIHRLERNPDQTLTFKLTFVEIPSGEDPRPPGDLGTISRLMTVTRKFRWGVIEKYLTRLAAFPAESEPERGQEVDDCLRDFGEELERLEADGAHLGFYFVDNVVSAFSDDQDKAKIKNMYDEWNGLRERLMKHKNAKNLSELNKALIEVRDINKGFMILAAKRLHELVQEM